MVCGGDDGVGWCVVTRMKWVGVWWRWSVLVCGDDGVGWCVVKESGVCRCVVTMAWVGVW